MKSLLALAAAALAFGLIAPSGAAALPDGAPYTLDGTAVHAIPARDLGRNYQVFISLPASYATSNRTYPVVFAADANYAFPVIRAITARAGNGGKLIGEFILVGLSYADGDSVGYSRRRDYTPSPTSEQGITSDMPGREPRFGEAEGYRRFIAGEVMPFIARRYRADMADATFVGHSYGSLLGLHTLLTEPGMFRRYILGSPSLWFNQHIMFERERAYAAAHRDLKAEVFFAVGGLETPKPSAYDAADDMVGDLDKFERQLRSRNYKSLRTQVHVIAGEDHLTVAPAIITRGLKWAVPGTP